MSIPCAQINLDDVTLAAQPAPNANGGKFVSISLRGGRPEDILLGDTGTFSRVAFEPEQDKTKPEKWAMKVDLSGQREAFVRALEAKAAEAAVTNGWLKKGLFTPSAEAVKGQLTSALKDSTKAEYPDATFKFHVAPDGGNGGALAGRAARGGARRAQ